jgi:hypothetical protein
MWVVSFAPQPFYPQGKSPQYPLNRRLGGPQNKSGRRGEKKIYETKILTFTKKAVNI